MATKNKTDYIFALGYRSDVCNGSRWVAAVTPRAYFQKNGYMYDQHLPVDVRGWSDVMEGFYEPDDGCTDPMKLYNGLMAQGFEWSQDFTDFLKSGDMEFVTMFTPGMIFVPPALDPDGFLNPPVVLARNNGPFMISGVSVAAPTCISGATKIDTALCKKAIVEMVKANPGLVAKDFYNPTPAEVIQMDTDASLGKNWKRQSKNKTCNGIQLLTERLFDCTPLDDQLRAYVRDDGKQIVFIEICGE